MHPPSYRGCWHGVSRCFLCGYRQVSSPLTVVYTPKSFIPHAVLLRQAFAHCAKFPTAASRRSMDRVSVPLWLIILSDQLSVIALVGRYPTNKLIDRRPLLERKSFTLARLSGISQYFYWLSLTLGQVPTCYSPVCRSQHSGSNKKLKAFKFNSIARQGTKSKASRIWMIRRAAFCFLTKRETNFNDC